MSCSANLAPVCQSADSSKRDGDYSRRGAGFVGGEGAHTQPDNGFKGAQSTYSNGGETWMEVRERKAAFVRCSSPFAGRLHIVEQCCRIGCEQQLMPNKRGQACCQ